MKHAYMLMFISTHHSNKILETKLDVECGIVLRNENKEYETYHPSRPHFERDFSINYQMTLEQVFLNEVS